MLGTLVFLYQVRAILSPFILAFFLVYLLNPPISKLVEKGMPRMGALIFVSGILTAVVGFILFSGLPLLIDELNFLLDRIPYYLEELEGVINRLNQRYQRIDISPALNPVLTELMDRVREFSLGFVERSSEAVLSFLTSMITLLVAPLLAFYVLKDLDEFEDRFWSLLPDKYHLGIYRLMTRINGEVMAFLKGQLVVSLFVGGLSVLGLWWLDVKFALLIGIMIGLLNIIPYFGPILGSLVAVIIAVFDSYNLALKVAILLTFIQQLESNILVPRIMEDKLGLHPALVIFSLLAGKELLGVVGMIIAIPAAAIIKELIYYILSFC